MRGTFSPNKKTAENWGSATEQKEVASGKRFCPTLPVLHKGMELQTFFVCVSVCVLSTCIPLLKEKMKNDKSEALATDFFFMLKNYRFFFTTKSFFI